jgi:hypothetical protein
LGGVILSIVSVAVLVIGRRRYRNKEAKRIEDWVGGTEHTREVDGIWSGDRQGVTAVGGTADGADIEKEATRWDEKKTKRPMPALLRAL